MKFFREKGNILKIILITFLSSGVLSYLVYLYSLKTLNAHVEASLAEIARQGAKIISNDIEKHIAFLETLAKIDTIANPSIPIEEKMVMIENNFKTGELLRISISDTEGNSTTCDLDKLYVGDREYFKRSLKGEKFVSDPLYSRIDGNKVVVFSVPLKYNGEIVGVLYATYPVEELSLMTDKIIYGEEGYSFIINKEGITIAHIDRALVTGEDNILNRTEENPEYAELNSIIKNMIEGKVGSGEYFYKGRKCVGYAPIEGTTWSIGVTAPREEVFKNLNEIIYFILISCAAVTLVFLSLNLYLDYTARKLKREQDLSKNVIDTAKILMIDFDNYGNVTLFNTYAEEKTGYKAKEIIESKTIYDLFDDVGKEWIKGLIEGNEEAYKKNREFAIIRKDKEPVYVLWNVEKNEKIEIIGIDVTERVLAARKLQEQHEELNALYEELAASEEELKSQFEMVLEQQEKLRYYAYNDPLTGLPNKLGVREFFNSSYINGVASLLFLDLDNFKLINDSYGHNYGDILLKQVGERLKEIEGYNYIAGRIGGDEFSILLGGIDDKEEIEEFCRKVFEKLSRTFKIEDLRINTSVSLGIARYPHDGKDFDEILKCADIAMYKAKELGRKRYVFFESSMNAEVIKRVLLHNYMEGALERKEFYLHYQPQFDSKTKDIVAFEALVRWKNPVLGMVPPSVFIPLAEENLMIIPLGKWILNEACSFIKEINERNSKEYIISVNISIVQILQDDFVDMVVDTLNRFSLNPKLLELELTETVLIKSINQIKDKLNELKRIGIKIALDDFGTGYSSLSYLRNLPITTLKIDKSFIDNIEREEWGTKLIDFILLLGEKLGLEIVAEGVEYEKQLDYLIEKNCHRIQGYLLSKPMDEDGIFKILNLNI